ncbi:hypothetical protein ACFX13_025172 [Malus domestica]
MGKRGFYPSVSTYSVMIHGLCKKKRKLEEACKYFMIDEVLQPAGSYESSMIFCYSSIRIFSTNPSNFIMQIAKPTP